MSITKRYFTSLSQALVGLVDLDLDQLDVRSDVVLAAEVEHLLGLAEARRSASPQAAAAEGAGEGSHRRASGAPTSVSVPSRFEQGR